MTEYSMSVGAPVQVNADWNATSGAEQVLNKPTKLTHFTNDLTGSSAGWTVPGVIIVNKITSADLSLPNTTVVAGTKLTWGNFRNQESRTPHFVALGSKRLQSPAQLWIPLDVYGGGDGGTVNQWKC